MSFVETAKNTSDLPCELGIRYPTLQAILSGKRNIQTTLGDLSKIYRRKGKFLPTKVRFLPTHNRSPTAPLGQDSLQMDPLSTTVRHALPQPVHVPATFQAYPSPARPCSSHMFRDLFPLPRCFPSVARFPIPPWADLNIRDGSHGLASSRASPPILCFAQKPRAQCLLRGSSSFAIMLICHLTPNVRRWMLVNYVLNIHMRNQRRIDSSAPG